MIGNGYRRATHAADALARPGRPAKQRIIASARGGVNGMEKLCLGPIILSPLNGPVKMSPYESGDISLESERVATSGRDCSVREGNSDVCQSRGAARSNT